MYDCELYVNHPGTLMLGFSFKEDGLDIFLLLFALSIKYHPEKPP